ITRAISEKRDIVPVFFHGRNSRLFYAVHSIRRFLKIKANIELILLPSEMFKKKNKIVKVSIGKPISYTQLNKDTSHNLLANQIRQHLYHLKSNPDETIFFK
ncbi:MAG: glycerol acyltransferase, partial [Bacteroidales bacterium]|nr:glycerol acyltransferase [Bacteroidales bacterium]